VRNRSANIKHTMKLWLEKKRSYLFSWVSEKLQSFCSSLSVTAVSRRCCSCSCLQKPAANLSSAPATTIFHRAKQSTDAQTTNAVNPRIARRSLFFSRNRNPKISVDVCFVCVMEYFVIRFLFNLFF
jgi:hypothetical protein